MKKGLLLLSCLSLPLVGSLGFKISEERKFHRLSQENHSLQRELDQFYDDQRFLEKQRTTIDTLNEKGWETPKSRLLAGEDLSALQGPHLTSAFTFHPQVKFTLPEGRDIGCTKIVLETVSPSDEFIYEMIERVLDEFPGVIFLRDLTLARGEGEDIPYIKGTLVFQWMSLKGGT